MIVSITPSVPSGKITLPASKSVAHRALIASACSDKPCMLSGCFIGDDVFATAKCLSLLGAKIQLLDDGLMVYPIKKPSLSADLYVGASGSTLRFMLPLVASLGIQTAFSGTERLSARPIKKLLDCMHSHGAVASSDALPVTVSGKLSSGDYYVDASESSQFITGLLLALPNVGGGKIFYQGALVSKNYVDITVSVMRSFGVTVIEGDGYYEVKGSYVSPEKFAVESDWSSATFFAVCGAIGDGIVLQGLNLNGKQGDKAVLDCLRLSGATVIENGDEVIVRKGKRKPFVFDVENCPDAAPALAVLASNCVGKSVITGTSRLKLKESDRSLETVKLLTSFGVSVLDEGDKLVIDGTGKLTANTISLPDDHRLAMSAAVGASVACGQTVLVGAECISKSYPTFFQDFNKLGGKANVSL